MTDYQGVTTALIISSVVSGLLIVGFYVWYAYALTKLFPKLGAEGWKGWVPILNEVVLLERGGVPGWSIVFYVLPVVQLYGIYLKVTALHRITESFGKGAGVTVLGLFLPPVWATLLASSRMPAPGAYDSKVDQLMRLQEGSPRAELLTPTVYASEPPAPPAAPVPLSFPSLAPSTPEPARLLEPEPVVPAPAAAAPTPAPAPVSPEKIVFPWASHDEAEETIITPAPAPLVAPVEADDLDRTIVVERQPFVAWRLVTDEGHVIPLRARRVLLGRKPSSSTDDVAVVAVPDSTKTLSKNHARLELSAEGAWSILDLDSTNGVIIIEPDGSETLLPPGGSAPVPGRFLLGRVGMQVSSDDLEETR